MDTNMLSPSNLSLQQWLELGTQNLDVLVVSSHPFAISLRNRRTGKTFRFERGPNVIIENPSEKQDEGVPACTEN